MFFHKINIDPAVASGPLITTINDLVAVITYYGLSGLVLIQLFHIKKRVAKVNSCHSLYMFGALFFMKGEVLFPFCFTKYSALSAFV